MKRGISYDYIHDRRGKNMLVLRKARGKFTLKEIEEILLYECRGAFNGRYALVVNTTENAAGGAGWGDEIEYPGDMVELYPFDNGEDCPICNEMLQYKDYCPHCGGDLHETERR